jgi:hypothetical protein
MKSNGTDPTPAQQQAPTGVSYSFGANELGVPVWFWNGPEPQYDENKKITQRTNNITIGVIMSPPPISNLWIAGVEANAPGDKFDKGILQISVQITESDPNNAEQDLENVSKIVQNNSSSLNSALSSTLGVKKTSSNNADSKKNGS